MSSSNVDFSTIAQNTLPFPHDPLENIEAYIPTPTMESVTEGIAANVPQKEEEVLSTDAVSGRPKPGRTPPDEKFAIAMLMLLLLFIQAVAAGGLLLLASFGSREDSAWLCKYSVPGFYVFFFIQTIGMQVYLKIIGLSTVQGPWRRFMKKCATAMVGMLLLVTAVLHLMRIYCYEGQVRNST